jgi:hypothetical protein
MVVSVSVFLLCLQHKIDLNLNKPFDIEKLDQMKAK